ncbi:MAG: type I secretion system permease/ATPase [Rhodobacteraceae bacterium]|nr:type I secretion system permease/ATPase [Paracoccaceae bacterium]
MASLFGDPDARTPLENAFRAASGPIALAALFSCFISMLMLVSPLYMMQVYDRVLASGSKETLLWLTVLIAFAFIIMALLEVARTRILGRVGLWIERIVSEPVIGAIVERRLSGGSPGAQPLRDLGMIRGFFGGGAMTALFDLPFTPLFLLALYALHPVLGYVGFGSAVLLFTVAVINERVTREPQKRSERFAVAAQSYVEATTRNAEAVRAMGLLPGVISRWREASDRALSAARRVNDLGGSIASGVKSFRMFIQSLVLGIGAYLSIDGQVSAGAIIAGSILLGRALAPIDQSINVWKGVISVREGTRRLNALMRLMPPPKDTQPLPPPTGALTVEGVTIYAGERPEPDETPILNRVSFASSPGTVVGVVGPSGAGKSTLCQALVGALRPFSGVIRLDNAALHFWNEADLGPYIGYLPQNVELIHGSVRDNIARLTDGDAEQVLAAARLADVHDMILRLPDGYDTSVGENGARLSAGQRQRIGLARALYGSPKLIVLDEPNANLDQSGEAALIEALEEMRARGSTIIVVAHRANVLSCADRLLVMRDGAVYFEGPRDEILERLYGPRAATALGGQTQQRVENRRQPLELAK